MGFSEGIAVVDLTGYDYYDTTEQEVTGVYAAVDTAYKSGKPILIHGWEYDGTLMSPMYVYVVPTTNAYIVDGKITVNSDDTIEVG